MATIARHFAAFADTDFERTVGGFAAIEIQRTHTGGSHIEDNLTFKNDEKKKKEPVNEIQRYQHERHVCSPEAVGKILGHKQHGHFPTVRKLRVDDVDTQPMVFTETQSKNPAFLQEKLLSLQDSNVQKYFDRPTDSKFDKVLFKDYFEEWKGMMPGDGTSIVMGERPSHDVSKHERIITPRSKVRVCRIPAMRPSQGDIYFLYVLLKSVPGRSYEDIRTVPGRKEPCSTYREAVKALGFLRDDDEHIISFTHIMAELGCGENADPEDPAIEATGPVLRPLLITFLEEGACYKRLREVGGKWLYDDFLQRFRVESVALRELDADLYRRLEHNQKVPEDYGLEPPSKSVSLLEEAQFDLDINRSRNQDQADAAEKARARCDRLQFVHQLKREGPAVACSARAPSADTAEEARAGCDYLQFVHEMFRDC